MPASAAEIVESLFDIDSLLTSDERDWRERAHRFASDRIKPTIDDDFEAEFFRRDLVPALASEGFLGMHINGYGCAGAGAVAYGLVCMELEAVDSGWRTFVSVQGSLAMTAIAKFGSEDQKQYWLPKMAAGSVIGCFALTEPTGGSDPGGMVVMARREGSEWVLSGQKRWIGLATVADVAVVWAKTSDGVRGFLVPTETPGFRSVAIEGKLSMRASIQCDIFLEDVRVADDAMLPGASGLASALSCLNEARFGIVWGVMGAARDCLEAAVERSRTRMVFGKAIGGMQLIQQKLANMLTEYEKGVLLALHIGRQKEAGTLNLSQISVGKLNNVRQAIAIASDSRSILGGDGVTNMYPVMRHLANLESVRTYEGTDEIHTLVIGRALTGEAAFA